MILYKSRKVNAKDAWNCFENSYKDTSPDQWSNFQIRQVAHIIKWASVSFNIRDSVKLSKSLITTELGQRGYVQHIHSVFPIVQGHNLGQGQITKYDYRNLLKQLVRWMVSSNNIVQFSILVKAVLEDIEKTFKKRMGWFWKMMSSWFTGYAKQLRELLKSKNVTTILESYNNSNTSKVESDELGKTEAPIHQTRVQQNSFRPIEVLNDTIPLFLCHKKLSIKTFHVVN